MVEAFVQQLAGLPAILEALSYHRAVPIAVVAEEVGLPPKKVRELLVEYFLTDEPDDRRGWIPPLEFLDASGEEADPRTAPCVRLTSDVVTNDLAFRYSPVTTWARTYRLARYQLHLDPENSLLEGALEKLGRVIDDELRPCSAIERGDVGPARWDRAAKERTKVAITYVRAWHPGTSRRIVEPYRVLRTRRGWEVDAGPPDESGRIRTYLLSGIVEAEFLDESLELPAGLERLLAEQRRTTPVSFVVPLEELWVLERLAEGVEEIRRDAEDVSLRAHFLEPVRARVAAALVTAGPRAMVLDRDLMEAGRELAAELLAHHRGD